MFEEHLSSVGTSLLGREAEDLQNKGKATIERDTLPEAFVVGQTLKLWIDMDRAQIAVKILAVEGGSAQLSRESVVEWNPDYDSYF